MFTSKAVASVLLASCAVMAHASTLTLDDIDQLSRAKVVKDLSSASAPATASPPSVSLAAPAPAPASAAPVPVGVEKKAHSHGTPVTFVGTYRDDRGSHVLYAYDSAVYDALTGKKLLNGWIAEKVSGFVVTVKYGRETWSETIRGGALASPAANLNPAVQAINDLGSPLPPAGLATMGATAPIGR